VWFLKQESFKTKAYFPSNPIIQKMHTITFFPRKEIKLYVLLELDLFLIVQSTQKAPFLKKNNKIAS
jgi:hypothetical protein